MGVAWPDGSGPNHVLTVLSAEMGLHGDLHRVVGSGGCWDLGGQVQWDRLREVSARSCNAP